MSQFIRTQSFRFKVFLLLAVCLVVVIAFWKYYASGERPLIGFYAVTGDFQCDYLTGRAPPPQKLTIARRPFLADADFLSWDVTNHAFCITMDATKRLWSSGGYVCSAGRPFVLVVNGEIIYLGAITELTSSSECMVPTIVLPVVQASLTNSVQKTLWCTISRSYPEGLVPAGSGPDPRDDKRIVRAVEELFAKRKQTDSAVK